MPLAVLELDGSSLALRMRPRFLERLFAGDPLVVQPADLEAVFPATGMLRSPGVGLRPHGRHVYYFWTRQRESVLTALAAAGWPVSWEERRFTR
jgi:hypothetical protein